PPRQGQPRLRRAPSAARTGPVQDRDETVLLPLPERAEERLAAEHEQRSRLEQVVAVEAGIVVHPPSPLDGEDRIEAPRGEDEALVGEGEPVAREPAAQAGGPGLRLEDEPPRAERLPPRRAEDPGDGGAAEARDDDGVEAVPRIQRSEPVAVPQREP